MKTILAIILAMLVALSTTTAVDEEKLLKDLSPDYESVATFIENHFDLFVTKCNEDSSEKWKAKGIEYKEYITIYKEDCILRGLFLDFSEDNGYAVLVDDYIMYDFQTKGESPYKSLVEYDELIYSTFTGYLYILDSVVYSVNEKFSDIKIVDDIKIGATTSSTTSSSYSTDITLGMADNYISSTYGKDYVFTKSKSLPMKNLLNQIDLSVYISYTDSYFGEFEGNCWAVAAYYVLLFYGDYKYPHKMPNSNSSTFYFEPSLQEPNIYSKYYDSKGNNITNISAKNSSKYNVMTKQNYFIFPHLWRKIRVYIDELYGDNESIRTGGSISQLRDVITGVANVYEVNLKTSKPLVWQLNINKLISNINAGNPFIWCEYTGSYGHANAGCGYRIYTRTLKTWIFTTKTEKILIEIKNGLTSLNKSNFIDLSVDSSSRGELILVED